MIVLTSTTYVGTTRELLAEPLADRGFQIGRISSWHSARSGSIQEWTATRMRMRPGCWAALRPPCSAQAADVLQSYARNVHPVSSPDAAEMTKLVENTFRAVNIALANEFAEICQ